MIALTTRDALAKALYDEKIGGRYYMERADAEEIADTLLASGVVVDAATLADDAFGDVSLVVARGIEGETASAVNGWGAHLVRVERCYSHGIARAALTALAAALSERSPR